MAHFLNLYVDIRNERGEVERQKIGAVLLDEKYYDNNKGMQRVHEALVNGEVTPEQVLEYITHVTFRSADKAELKSTKVFGE